MAADVVTKRVILIRHGESEANVTGKDIIDPLLTTNGKLQASSWAGRASFLNAEVILTSPLRRAVETACLVFSKDSTPIEICGPARELWWHHKQNNLGTRQELKELLAKVPRGSEVKGVDDLDTSAKTEGESVSKLKQVLRQRPEKTIAVVCHYLLIDELSNAGANNGEFIVCEYTSRVANSESERSKRNSSGAVKASERFEVVERHRPPGGPSTCW
eukprot:gnl/TRDRNA2_/TRDRNA2_168475_c0_seq1.p1 gnl/TRDRNA2_/TRDRNA2_168475_c0~~gnl/TRDRNA2_/TRDRNA2_168475_c0_seq1.p1  ORF type:complete len:217 (-),score=35.94 gnl/TRDRNA2_/TRDRNA2_168475_c0_seq1:77-727(-)